MSHDFHTKSQWEIIYCQKKYDFDYNNIHFKKRE